ncbi:hypothetical protein Hdeb2414_s0011g00370891 [Helianthus debilis subsp. tardiflorus]
MYDNEIGLRYWFELIIFVWMFEQLCNSNFILYFVLVCISGWLHNGLTLVLGVLWVGASGSFFLVLFLDFVGLLFWAFFWIVSGVFSVLLWAFGVWGFYFGYYGFTLRMFRPVA